MSSFATVLADPPWRTHSGRLTGRRGFADAGRGAKNRPLPYATMSVAEIKALPVGDIAADNAHLWLWTINGYLDAAFGVIRAWGFSYSTTHVWAKAPMGGGLGESFGITTEFLLFARRGRAPMFNRTTGTWHTWPRRYVNGAPAHSKKPDGSYALIESASHAPFVELFSRENQPRLGWSYWGNESLGTAGLALGAPR
jgi:N6-adenosine-specific RNA methylase IME4